MPPLPTIFSLRLRVGLRESTQSRTFIVNGTVYEVDPSTHPDGEGFDDLERDPLGWPLRLHGSAELL